MISIPMSSEWTRIQSGKYEGKTLPQIILLDPSWFFWCFDQGYFDKGRLAHQAKDLHEAARTLSAPRLPEGPRDVEYYLNPHTAEFLKLELVPRSQPTESIGEWVIRRRHLDLSIAYEHCQGLQSSFTLAEAIRRHLRLINWRKPTAEECNAVFRNMKRSW